MSASDNDQIRVVQGKPIYRGAKDTRGTEALIAGVATGTAAGTGFGAWVWNKLWKFDTEVVKRVREDITKSTGAGLDSIGRTDSGLAGGSHIHDHHERAFIEETKNTLAKVRKFFGGTLGIGLAVGVAVGAVGAGLYAMLAPKKENENPIALMPVSNNLNLANNPEKIRDVTKDMMKELGTSDFLEKYSAAKNPDEREKLKAEWADKLTKKEMEKISPDVAVTQR